MDSNWTIDVNYVGGMLADAPSPVSTDLLSSLCSVQGDRPRSAGCAGMNKLYYGDNLDVLRESINDESADLIYLDPPFNSEVNYNVLFRTPSGTESDAQVEAFRDTWEWAESAQNAYADVIQANGDIAIVVSSL